MSGLGGIVLAARLQLVDLNAGGGTLLLDAISAGGDRRHEPLRRPRRDPQRAHRRGVISTIANGMFILGYATGIIFIVTGVILLLAVTFDTVVRRLQVRSGR